MPSLEETLKGSRAYKRLYRRGGLDEDDSQSQAGLSVASSDKGCDWSMLSDMSLGDLSISDLAVIELPIYTSDLYDPEPYRTASRRGTSSKRRYEWSSKSRIHNAISGGNDFVVRTLLGLGFDIEERDGKGQTPLLHAIRRENEVIVGLLLEKGANLEAQDADGRTPLAAAVRRELETIVRLLLDKGPNLETPDAKGLTALWHALLGNNAAIVALLLEKGADRETKNAEGLTPHPRSTTNSTLLIHDAIEHGHEEVIRLLLTLDADVEQRDTQGHTPLAHAAIRNHEAIATLLLQQGANREAAIGTLAGSTTTLENPLRAAIIAGNEIFLRQLLAVGADVEQRDKQGLTPLALAVLRNDERSVKLLLEKGASSNHLREIGSTRDLKGKIHTAIEAGNENVVRLLLVMGVDVEERTEDRLRHTPLLWACSTGKSAIAKILVAQGADVKACSEQGWTVLHEAVWHDDASLLTFFLDNGALDVIDVAENAEDAGNTPLHRAAYFDSGLPLAQILVERGARLNIKNKAGRTPYENALFGESRNVAKYLWSQLEPNERALLKPPPSH
jgi:ankyrin repeat protein